MKSLNVKILNERIIPLIRALASMGWIDIKEEEKYSSEVNEQEPNNKDIATEKLSLMDFKDWLSNLRERAEPLNISEEEVNRLSDEVRKQLHASSKN